MASPVSQMRIPHEQLMMALREFGMRGWLTALAGFLVGLIVIAGAATWRLWSVWLARLRVERNID